MRGPGRRRACTGRAADPWLINCEPEKGKFEVPGLALPSDVPAARFESRRGEVRSRDSAGAIILPR